MSTSFTQPTLKPGTKILFATFPADGHFNPLTGIAVHLKNMGCDVRWYTSPTYKHKVERLDIPFYPMRKAFDISVGDPEEIFPERKKRKSQVAKLKFDMVHIFVLRGPEFYEDVLDIYNEFEFELLVSDICFTGNAFVKEKMGIPVVAVDVFPLPETSKDLAPCGLGMTPSYSFMGRIKQGILRFVADNVLFAEPRSVMRKIFAEHGIKVEGSNLFDEGIKKANIVLQSGTPSFEYNRSDISSHVHFVGPLLPYTKKQTGKPWFDSRLNTYEHVVLVTQGTVEKDINKLLIPTLEAFKDSEVLVVATTGGSKTEELRQRYPQPNIIIEDFIPFDEVMPYADVYVTNGGYGGVLLSIQNNLPMVVAGVHEGKNEINARIGYFGLGINLKTETPLPYQIRQSVLAVFNDNSYSKKVETLNEEFAQYDTYALTTKYVASLLRQNMVMKQEDKIREDVSVY